MPQLQGQANPAAGLTNLPNWFWMSVQQGQLDPGRGFSVDIPWETTWQEEVEECQSGQVPGSDPPVLQVGPEGYGLLLAAPGAGAIVGVFGLGAVKSLRRIDLVMLIAMACFCLLMMMFTLSRTFGLEHGVYRVRLDAAAAAFPRTRRGRVMSLTTVANIGMSQLGGMLVAATATWVGAPVAVSGAALFARAVAMLIGLSRGGWRTEATNLQAVPAEA